MHDGPRWKVMLVLRCEISKKYKQLKKQIGGIFEKFIGRASHA